MDEKVGHFHMTSGFLAYERAECKAFASEYQQEVKKLEQMPPGTGRELVSEAGDDDLWDRFEAEWDAEVASLTPQERNNQPLLIIVDDDGDDDDHDDDKQAD